MEQLKTLMMESPEKWAHGSDVPRKQYSDQELEQMRADSYNRSVGRLNETDGFECAECKNKGYIATVYHNEQFGYYAETLVPCKCQKVRRAIQRLNRSGLKNVVRDYTFQKYETPEPWQQAIKNAALQFCEDKDNNWFFLGGQSGAGKTHICSAIAVHYIRHEKETHYMLWRDEIVKIKAVVNDAEQYAALMNELKKVDVLYIDDLFKTGKNADGNVAAPSAADVNAAFEIINYRYNNPELITIISSERTLNALNAIDEAIAGRIAERSKAGGYCLNIGPDKNKNYRTKGVIEL